MYMLLLLLGRDMSTAVEGRYITEPVPEAGSGPLAGDGSDHSYPFEPLTISTISDGSEKDKCLASPERGLAFSEHSLADLSERTAPTYKGVEVPVEESAASLLQLPEEPAPPVPKDGSQMTYQEVPGRVEHMERV